MIAIARENEDTADVADLLSRLAHLGNAVLEIASLPERLGMEPEALATTLDDAATEGWVEYWATCPSGPAVMLSHRAAQRLDLVLQAPPDLTFSRALWVSAAKVKAERALSTCEADVSDPTRGEGGIFDQITDPDAIDGLSMLIEAEATTDRLARMPRPVGEPVARKGIWKRFDPSRLRLPQIRLILGLGIPWFGSDQWPPPGPCPGCGGRELPPIAACLICSRSGVDDRLGKLSPAELPRAYNPDSRGGLGCGRGKKTKPSRKTKGKKG